MGLAGGRRIRDNRIGVELSFFAVEYRAMSIAAPLKYRPEDLLAMEQGPRYELINGELVEKAAGAEASRVGGNLVTRLNNHIVGHGGGHVFPSNCGYQTFARDPNQVRYPDVSFIRKGRLPADRVPKGHVRIPPDLEVEIVSPNDTAEDTQLFAGI